MKNLVVVALVIASSSAMAQSHHRSGYITKNGTYVAPSYATNPNGTKLDNYSTKGNFNPYTGKLGTVDPYTVQPAKPSLPQPTGIWTAQPLYVPQK